MMKNRIFTDYERSIIRVWLEKGEKNANIYMLWSRIRRAKELREDIELYKKAMKRLMQSYSH
jgi:hypothetical protein